MSTKTFDVEWDDAEKPKETAAALSRTEKKVTRERQKTRQQETEQRIAAALEATRPGLDKIPDPVEPAGEGELTGEELERLELCNQGIALHSTAWFMAGKALDTVATGKLFRRTPHKLEPDRFYATIEEWAEVENGISVSKCNQWRAAWPIGEVLQARGHNANPGQVRELVPVKTAYGLNAAVAVYVLVAESVGADKVTAARLRETVKLMPGDLQLDDDEDPDILAKTIKGVLLGELPASAPSIPPAVTRAVDRRAVDLANVLDRGRIPRSEVNLYLMRAFADEEDPTVFNAVLERMKQDAKEQKRLR